ncbi:MAG: AAA family ATPase [Candidatus Aminicenantes bacterium]|nr:AAA family ATPase [Candidatus Aminicenantes bacterium]
MKTIAISGKGGTGKTTVAALIIRWLSEQVSKSILAVDADSNVNLNDVLGVELKETIGSIREEMKSSVSNLPGGMNKNQFLEYKIQSSLVETPDYDLIAMGRPEGPGCYCYANNLLREILNTLHKNYQFVVIDNEAGMEHLSRRTAHRLDYLLIISDPSLRGIRTAGKISRLLKELDTRVGEKYLVLNRVLDSIPPSVKKAIEEEGVEHLYSIPEDERLFILDQSGKPIWTIASDTTARRAVGQLTRKLLNLEKEGKL